MISKTFLDKKVSDGIYTATLPLQNDDPRYIELKRAIQSKMSAEYNEISGISAAISRILRTILSSSISVLAGLPEENLKRQKKGFYPSMKG